MFLMPNADFLWTRNMGSAIQRGLLRSHTYLNAAGHCWTYTNNFLGKRKFQTDRFTRITCLQCESEADIANCTTCGLFPDIIARSLKIVQEISVRLRAERFKRHRKYYQRKKCGSAWTMECSHIARSVLKTWTNGQSFGSNVYVLIVNCKKY